jgi:four helix bundle protein
MRFQRNQFNYMNNKEFSKILEQRTKNFALRIIRLSSNLPDTTEAKVIRNQITKSGTSIGANYREANRSRSRADFNNKVRICESEASETQYWLEIIVGTKWIQMDKIQPVINECSELLALFTSIGKKG